MSLPIGSNPDRPHSHHSHIRSLSTNSNNTSNDNQQQLFLCFSSSSMKITKSILSPSRDISLSRRLKPNNSLKLGAQSPMFPTTTISTTRKKGFENPEPSSPKVTCIGQVRVKSKKKKTLSHHPNNIKSRSQRRSVDYSFRRNDGEDGFLRQSSISLESSQRQRQNTQKWVHMPITLCESLRSFGSDFNCFVPCRSEDGEQGREATEGCGSVLARWLVPVHEGEGRGKGRQIELVVAGGGGREDGELCGRRSYRKRHVMEDIDISEIEKDVKGNEIVCGRRVSICIPPKNALLLMRCGSDPVKMAAIANRLWEPPEKDAEEAKAQRVVYKIAAQKTAEYEDVGDNEFLDENQPANMLVSDLYEQVTYGLVDQESHETISLDLEMKCDGDIFVTEEMYGDVLDEKLRGVDVEQKQTVIRTEDNAIEIPVDAAAEKEFSDDEMKHMLLEEEEAVQLVTSPLSQEEEPDEDTISVESIKVECSEEVSNADMLPDCLLLMMCEPKLSMEVSQETWVCTTDFIRWLPPREVNTKNTTTTKKNDNLPAADELLSKRVSVHYKPPKAPPRSSCSYPAPPVKVGEPLYNLTRCKSEPRRTAAKLGAAGGGSENSCFWKKRTHEPVGLGAAGVGC